MQRLLNDAQKLTGTKYDINNLNDVFQAIHVIQGELDITGTTAKEASETISGSVSSAKSAFENFLSGAGGIEEVITTFTTAGTNISNAIIQMTPRIVTGLSQLFTALIPSLPPLIQQLLPALISGVSTLIMGIVGAMPQLISVLVGALPAIIQQLSDMVPEILTALLDGTIQIIQSLADQMPELIPVIIDAILKTIPLLISYAPEFGKAGLKLIWGLIKGLVNSVPDLLRNMRSIGDSLFGVIGSWVRDWINAGVNLAKGLWQGIGDSVDWVVGKIRGFGKKIVKGVKEVFGIHSPSTEFAWVGKMNMLGLEKGMEDMQGQVSSSINGMFDDMFDLSPSLYGSASNNLSPNVTVVNNVNVEQDPLGQMVNDIKTFSGGSKNDYNYGMGV